MTRVDIGRPSKLTEYIALVNEFRERGYTIGNFRSDHQIKWRLVLRHDVDMSLDYAVQMARAEADAGIASTYFILVRTELYNPLSRSAGAALREISAAGHRLGLHFDASLYNSELSRIEAAASLECTVLESLAGVEVDAISFHRPAPQLLGTVDRLAGRPTSYGTRFFKDFLYSSDSRGGWHHGHPLSHPELSRGRSLQLLTHPIWWATGSPSTEGALLQFISDRSAAIDSALAEECSLHKPKQRKS